MATKAKTTKSRTATATSPKRAEWLDDVQQRLDPKVMRHDIAGELDEVFRSGTAPDPLPEGFLLGRLLTMTWRDSADAFVARVARMYMPWLGKSFDPEGSKGVNVLRTNARRPMKVLWPRYVPERELADRIEAFPFTTRIEEGAVDPGVRVLKIDYDFDANPQFLIRSILDELVQIDEGVYLGKILFRRKDRFDPIGFFALESPRA
jgi:hypothetical protein